MVRWVGTTGVTANRLWSCYSKVVLIGIRMWDDVTHLERRRDSVPHCADFQVQDGKESGGNILVVHPASAAPASKSEQPRIKRAGSSTTAVQPGALPFIMSHTTDCQSGSAAAAMELE